MEPRGLAHGGCEVTGLLVSVGVLLALLVSYYLFPLQWAPLLVFLERSRSGVAQKRLTVGGRTFSYLEGGKGFPVVLVHGFGASSDLWVPMAARLVKRFRVVAPDVPGFGGTSASASEQFLLRTQAERLHEFLQALGIRRYHLVGNSMGGHIAGVLAHDHPEEVESLTLLEPHGIVSRIPTEVDVQIRQGLAPLVPREPAEFDHIVDMLFVKRPFIPRAVYLQLRHKALASEPLHRVIWRDLWNPETANLLEQILPGIRTPTLVIWGDSNRFLHETAVEKLEQGLRDVRVVRMKACGHSPMFERPAEVVEHFEQFLTHLGAAASGPAMSERSAT
jgi:pimeloyl-ACP methyl ester carboxylesterase